MLYTATEYDLGKAKQCVFYLHLKGAAHVVGLLDRVDVLVIEYRYDVWGKTLPISGNFADILGKCTSFRHHGYVCDLEANSYFNR